MFICYEDKYQQKDRQKKEKADIKSLHLFKRAVCWMIIIQSANIILFLKPPELLRNIDYSVDLSGACIKCVDWA